MTKTNYTVLLCGKENDNAFIHDRFRKGFNDPNYLFLSSPIISIMYDDLEILLEIIDDKETPINEKIDAYAFIINIKDPQT